MHWVLVPYKEDDAKRAVLPYTEEDDKSDEELDKQMGNIGDAEADKLDERLWGDDNDDDEEDDESDNEDDNITETGPGMDEVKT